MEDCIVCYDNVPDEMIQTKCSHIYCTACFVKHMRRANTCAMCRTELVDEAPIVGNKDMDDDTVINMADVLANDETLHNILSRIYQNIDTKLNRYIDNAFNNNTIKHTRIASTMIEICRRLFRNLNLEYTFWYFSIHNIEAVRSWYRE